MGSRAVVVLCRDDDVARRRFGVVGEGQGIIYTRTGRRFFDSAALESGLIDVVARAADQSALWERLSTDWVVLDCELMPWSAKAQALIREQYAAVSASASAALPEAVNELARGSARGLQVGDLLRRFQVREQLVRQYT